MIHSRLIRTAINFSLIIALVTQPMIVSAAMACCSAGCSGGFSSTGFNCQGCGCCEVATTTELCGCCGGDEETNSQEKPDSQTSCCSHGDDAIADASSVGSDCDLTEPKSAVSAVAAGSGEKCCGLDSRCLCGQETRPLGEPSARRTSSEDRDQTSSGYLNSTAVDAVHQTDPRVATQSVSVHPLEHFSQVMLCIWRL